MLWRAHITSHQLFSQVNLGKHANTLRSHIANGVAPKYNEYSIVFFHYIDQDYSKIIIPPWKDKLDRVNVYRFYLPELVILIKVDQRPMPVHFEKMLLREQPPHHIILLPNVNSSEQRYIDNVRKQLRKNSNG
jgi:hypothetical protein